MAKITIIGVLPESLINFRGELLKTLSNAGHEVIAMADSATKETIQNIEQLGAKFIAYPIERTGMNPIKDLKTLYALYRELKKQNPDYVLAYTIKPVIWGGVAARILGKSSQFQGLITGLGFAFQSERPKQKILTYLVKKLYKVALKYPAKVIFQNQDNQRQFIDQKIILKSQSYIVNGSGVCLDYFKKEPLPEGNSIVFLTIARLLAAKGLREFAAAAKEVKKLYPLTQFKLLGPEDPSPDRIPIEEIREWHNLGVIEYCGESDDVRPWIKNCHVFVLNSYNEGMPRTVLEAMSTGRPIITTLVPGCRETVIEGVNGYLVAKSDINALVEAMIKMIENKQELAEMGNESRKIAVEKFNVHQVNNDLIRLMKLK